MAAKDLVLLGGGHSHVEVLRVLGLQRRMVQQPQSARPPTEPTATGEKLKDGGPAGGSSGGYPSAASATEPRVTVISRGRFTPYSGMLPGWASGFYSYGDCHIDLQRLASYAGARLVVAEATGIDIAEHSVRFTTPVGHDGSRSGDGAAQCGTDAVSYDVLSIDVGITPGRATIPGADRHATAVKPIDGFVQRYEQLLERYRAAAKAATAAAAASAAVEVGCGAEGPGGGAPHPAAMRVCIVGGGAGGVELAAAVQYRLEEERRRGGWSVTHGSASVRLVCRGGLLPGHPPHVRRLVRQLLLQRGVELLPDDAVTRVEPGELLLRSGARVPYDECLWCTEASPAPWLRQTGLPTDPGGFLSVNDRLQSDGGPPEVFAAGDVASCAAHPRPKAGVYAVRQGPPLATNLRAFLEGRPLQPFVPQESAMALISLGNRFCVVSRTGLSALSGNATGTATATATADGDAGSAVEWPLGWLLNGFGGLLVGVTGPLLWRWKDHIDRGFMRKYGQDLPVGTAAHAESAAAATAAAAAAAAAPAASSSSMAGATRSSAPTRPPAF